ncbi:hypothetical protein B484DRAFT_411466, partial [Ochromonadaceae sp. CCMP2298]
MVGLQYRQTQIGGQEQGLGLGLGQEQLEGQGQMQVQVQEGDIQMKGGGSLPHLHLTNLPSVASSHALLRYSPPHCSFTVRALSYAGLYVDAPPLPPPPPPLALPPSLSRSLSETEAHTQTLFLSRTLSPPWADPASPRPLEYRAPLVYVAPLRVRQRLLEALVGSVRLRGLVAAGVAGVGTGVGAGAGAGGAVKAERGEDRGEEDGEEDEGDVGEAGIGSGGVLLELAQRLSDLEAEVLTFPQEEEE